MPLHFLNRLLSKRPKMLDDRYNWYLIRSNDKAVDWIRTRPDPLFCQFVEAIDRWVNWAPSSERAETSNSGL